MLKVLLKRHKHFFKLFFIHEHVNIFIVVIAYILYICVKSIAIFYVEFTKKWSIFHSKIHKHPACRMNRDEHEESRLKISEHTFWVNILFEWPQSLFAATKIYILIFNLTHSFISLMGSFHFPKWKIFLPIHWQIRNILWNEIPQLIMLSLKCDHPLLYEFPSYFLHWSLN